MAQEFGIQPVQWDELPVTERARLIAFSRDDKALKYIAGMPADQRRNLRGTAEWTTWDEDS